MKDIANGFIISAVLHTLLFASVLAWTGTRYSTPESEPMTVSLVGSPRSGTQGSGDSRLAGAGRSQAGSTVPGEPGVQSSLPDNSLAADIPMKEEQALPSSAVATTSETQHLSEPVKEEVRPAEEKDALPVKSKKETRKKPEKGDSPKKRQVSEKKREKTGESARADNTGPQTASTVQGQSLLTASGTGKETGSGFPGNAGEGGGERGPYGGGTKTGSGGGYLKANYNYILKHIHKHLRYPRQAEVMQQTGTALYRFYVEKNGRVSQVSIKKSTNFPLLDKAGEKAINAASPLPPPPEPTFIDIPIHFTLK